MNTPTNPEPPTIANQTRWFTDEVHAHDSSLRAYLRGSFPAVRDVDDVVQESYLRIWRARPETRIQCARAFLFRVARNVALNLLRRERTSPITSVENLGDIAVAEKSPGVVATACAREEYLVLAAAIDHLPPRCREVVILSRVHNLSQKEIAERLGLSENTVGVHVARGVERCMDYLRHHGVNLDHGGPQF
ncbi:MAG TPA: RNA polymerase sigma factor [Opitutaceae bacterium]|nr:RNA polymerase sigma factor [Opitutaceae bacterium]